MLDNNDIKIIKSLLEEQSSRMDKRFDTMNEKFEVLDGKVEDLSNKFEVLDGKVEDLSNKFEVLDGKVEDLSVKVENLSDEVEVLNVKFEVLDGKVEVLNGEVKELKGQFEENKQSVADQFLSHRQEISKEMKAMEKRLEDKIDSSALKTERLLLNEMERYHDIYTTRMGKIEKDVADIKQYYRIYKLEHDNTGMLLNIVDDLQDRVERLELKMA